MSSFFDWKILIVYPFDLLDETIVKVESPKNDVSWAKSESEFANLFSLHEKIPNAIPMQIIR